MAGETEVKLTNKHNLPPPILEAIRRDPYSKGEAHFSATELIESPRIHGLRSIHYNDIEKDASDLVFSLLGRAVHGLLERYGRRAGLADYVEKRFYCEVGGWRVSGGMDLQLVAGDVSDGGASKVTILDWKLTTAKSARIVKVEWERQLNIYAYLYMVNTGSQPDALEVCAIIRDWKKEAAQAQPDYPQAPIIRVPIRLWEPQRQLGYLQERIAVHAAARAAEAFGDPLPACTDEERWKRGGSWALWKNGNKRATSIFDNKTEAEAALLEAQEKAREGTEFRLDLRPAVPHRCVHYCDVAPFCSQWAEERQALNLKGMPTDED